MKKAPGCIQFKEPTAGSQHALSTGSAASAHYKFTHNHVYFSSAEPAADRLNMTFSDSQADHLFERPAGFDCSE